MQKQAANADGFGGSFTECGTEIIAMLDDNGDGVVDILDKIDEGNLLILYSGGLHHVHAPGDAFPKPFRTIRLRFEQMPVRDYKASVRRWL